MNVLLYGRYGDYPSEIEAVVKAHNVTIVKENPDLIITFGGDGTLVGAERDYPGIPKLPLKDSRLCHRCVPLTPEQTLQAFSENKLELVEFAKLEAKFNDQTLLALNDVIIRNTSPNIALRFDVHADGSDLPGLIGDGMVVATPFGSSGYYHSITKQEFKTGIGIAFNNLCDSVTPLFISINTDERIVVTVTRGPGTLSCDNSPKLIELSEGMKIEIGMSTQSAKIYTLPVPSIA